MEKAWAYLELGSGLRSRVEPGWRGKPRKGTCGRRLGSTAECREQSVPWEISQGHADRKTLGELNLERFRPAFNCGHSLVQGTARPRLRRLCRERTQLASPNPVGARPCSAPGFWLGSPGKSCEPRLPHGFLAAALSFLHRDRVTPQGCVSAAGAEIHGGVFRQQGVHVKV